jgi:hypothetical protein
MNIADTPAGGRRDGTGYRCGKGCGKGCGRLATPALELALRAAGYCPARCRFARRLVDSSPSPSSSAHRRRWSRRTPCSRCLAVGRSRVEEGTMGLRRPPEQPPPSTLLALHPCSRPLTEEARERRREVLPLDVADGGQRVDAHHEQRGHGRRRRDDVEEGVDEGKAEQEPAKRSVRRGGKEVHTVVTVSPAHRYDKAIADPLTRRPQDQGNRRPPLTRRR